MALDRFIHFDHGNVPSAQRVKDVLHDFLGPQNSEFRVTEDGDRLTAVLPGRPSEILRRAVPDATPCRCSDEELYGEERWIEVHIGSDNIDVITRSADAFTNAVAEGFARRATELFSGRADSEWAEWNFNRSKETPTAAS